MSTMPLFLIAMGLLVGSGIAAACVRSRPVLSTWLGAGGSVIGCLLAMLPAILGLCSPPASARWEWSVPGGSFFVEIDALSAFFLIPILTLSLVASLYGARYLRPYAAKRHLGGAWFFYNLLVAGMAMVTVARNAVLFLTAWEIMAIASFFLVTFEHEKTEVRRAGWTYLAATHLGTAFLLAFFLLIGKESLDFDHLSPGTSSGALFLLAVIGFGTKAGFMPFHVWLPEAHPAAPSHVSALMSGVMIKTGIYGLIRALGFLGPPSEWWGWMLLIIGFASGVMGVLFALGQRDLKRLLAYSSVENVGIMTLGIGMGLLGLSYHKPEWAILGFAGTLLHVAHHALFKGLLFLGAGAVAHAAHTREIDLLGGLLKRMPRTGGTFLIGVVAICGLPPFNGFVSEFLLYLGAYTAVKSGGSQLGMGMLVIGGLALIGGFAAICFTKAFGIVFLGEPRSREAAEAREAPLGMLLPMWVLAGGCLFMGLAAPRVLPVIQPVIVKITGWPIPLVTSETARAADLLWKVCLSSGVLLALIFALTLLRKILLRGKEVRSAVTWDCGYTQPNPRMQYSGSSFVGPITSLFGSLLHRRKKETPPEGFFPQQARIETQMEDPAREKLYRPLFLWIDRISAWARVLQHGRVNIYILYIALTLTALLIWSQL